MTPLPESGRLDETALPRLLLELHRAEFSGSLTLSRERVGKRFLFHEGSPVFAESNLASESLGVQLMDSGQITRSDYTKMVSYIEREKCKEGKALLDLRLIDPRGLFLALKDQLRTRVIECFGWPQGEFFVDPHTGPSEGAQPFRTDIYGLLQEGIDAHWSHDRVLSELTPSMERYPVPSRAFESIRMRLVSDEHVEGLLQALDGTRTLWKVLQGAGSHRALAAAWVVNSAGGLDYCDAPVGADGVTPEVEIVVGTETSESAARRSSADRAPPSSPSAPHRGGAAAATLRREITERFERLAGLSYYELLGLTADASLAAIKGAYHKAAKRYHPDALVRSGVDAEARARASRVFVEIGKAHAVLADPGQRREYDASLAGDADLDGNQLIQAETLYRKGEILLRQGNFAGAIEYLEPAVQLWPEEAEYQSALGWSLYKKLPPDAAKARTHLEKAVTLAPNDGVVHFRLGLVLRALGQHDDAAAALARAKRLDPNLR